MTHIHEYHVGSLLVITSDQVIGEKGFPTATGAEDKLVSVGTDATFYRFIGQIHMYWFSGESVSQPYSKWAN